MSRLFSAGSVNCCLHEKCEMAGLWRATPLINAGGKALSIQVNNNFSSHQPFSCIFSLFALKYYHYLFEVIPFVFS